MKGGLTLSGGMQLIKYKEKIEGEMDEHSLQFAHFIWWEKLWKRMQMVFVE